MSKQVNTGDAACGHDQGLLLTSCPCLNLVQFLEVPYTVLTVQKLYEMYMHSHVQLLCLQYLPSYVRICMYVRTYVRLYVHM